MPIDILQIVTHFADIEQADWPKTSVDGITINCADPRPQIFYIGDADDRRTRFTIAHELGHAVMPWHIGTAECAMPAPGQPSFRSPVEKEADEFAAELLLPADWLRAMVRKHAGNLDPVLSEVDSACVSATASLIALSNVLTIGWALQLNNKPIVLPRKFRTTLSRSEAERAAFASGAVNVHQQAIRWWRFFNVPALPDVPPDKETAYASLDKAWLEHGDGRDRKLIDGSVSGAIGSLGGIFGIDVAFGYLLYRLQLDGPNALYEDPDFRSWLGWKAQQGADRHLDVGMATR